MYYQPTFQPDEVIEYLRKSRSDDPMLTVEEVLAKHETILNEWSEKHLGSRISIVKLFPEKRSKNVRKFNLYLNV